MILLSKTPPTSTATVLSSVPEHKKTIRCLTEKIRLSDELHSGLSSSFVGCELDSN